MLWGRRSPPMATCILPQRPVFKRQVLTCVIATVVVLVRPAMAGAQLDLVMDDPGSLIKSQPDGLSRLTSAFASSKATIASGPGGRAVPQLAAPASGESADAKVQILSEPALGPSSFFRATLNGSSQVKQVGLAILPDKEASLQTFVTRENGLVKIAGGFDFLFRASSNNGSPKVQLLAKIANLSVAVGTNPADGMLTLRVYTAGKSLAVSNDKSGKRAMIEKRSEIHLDSDAIYHGAVVFNTAADGSLVVSLCIVPSAGTLDVPSAVAVSIDGFDLLEDASSKETDKIVFNLNREETSQQTLDIAAFRIFKPVPEILPGFEAKKP